MLVSTHVAVLGKDVEDNDTSSQTGDDLVERSIWVRQHVPGVLWPF
jgi:hypothetical protein